MKTSNLKAIVKKLRTVKKRNTAVPIVENYHVKDGKITAFNFEQGMTLPIDTPFNGLIDADSLYKILQKLKTDEIDFINHAEKDTFSIAAGRNVFDFKADDIEEYPYFPSMVDCGSLHVCDLDTIQKLKHAMKFVGTDELRESMMNVSLGPKGIAATDAHCMYFDRVSRSENEYLIDPFLIKHMASETILCNSATYTLAVNDDKDGESSCFFSRRVEAKFPNWESVIPENQTGKVSFDKKEMIAAVELALINANKKTNKIKLSAYAHSELVISSEDLDLKRSFRTVINSDSVLPESYESGFTVGLNGAFLVKILKETQNSILTIDFSAPNRAFIVDNNFLIMPFLLN